MDKKTILMSASKEISCPDAGLNIPNLRLVGVQSDGDTYNDTYQCDYTQVVKDFGYNQHFNISGPHSYSSAVFTKAECEPVGAGNTAAVYDNALDSQFSTAQLELACYTGGVCTEALHNVASNTVEDVLQQGEALRNQSDAMVSDSAILCQRSRHIHRLPQGSTIRRIPNQLASGQSDYWVHTSYIVLIVAIFIMPLIAAFVMLATMRRPPCSTRGRQPRQVPFMNGATMRRHADSLSDSSLASQDAAEAQQLHEPQLYDGEDAV